MTEVIAHRGASAYAPENTFAAFGLALAQGADALELDVRSTSDGRLVVLHDATLLRTAGDPRPIARVRAEELASIDAAVRPPTLDAVLDRYGSTTRWLLELKDPTPRSERALAGALLTRGLERATVVQAFGAMALRRLRAVATFAAAVGVRHSSVDMALRLRAQSCGLAVRAWTANAVADIERLRAIGVAGVITDVPDVARAVADARGVASAA